MPFDAEKLIDEKASLAKAYAGDGALFSAARIIDELHAELVAAATAKETALNDLIAKGRK